LRVGEAPNLVAGPVDFDAYERRSTVLFAQSENVLAAIAFGMASDRVACWNISGFRNRQREGGKSARY